MQKKRSIGRKLPRLEMESDPTQRRERKRCPGNKTKTTLNRLCQVGVAWNRRFRSTSYVVTAIRLGTATHLKVDQYREDGKRQSGWGLCYRCLSDDHLGNLCPNRECKIDERTDTHHRLLHAGKATSHREIQRGSSNGTNLLLQVTDNETKTAI